MIIRKFEDIEGWRLARLLMNRVYRLTSARTFEEDWDLRKQMRRAGMSAMANIAEGFKSGTNPEFARFLRISQRSAAELQSHLYVALDQAYVSDSAFREVYDLAERASTLIGGFIRFLETAKPPPSERDVPLRKPIRPGSRNTRNEKRETRHESHEC